MIGGTALAAALWIVAVTSDSEVLTSSDSTTQSTSTWRAVRKSGQAVSRERSDTTTADRSWPKLANRDDDAGKPSFEARSRSLDEAAQTVAFDSRNWPADFTEAIRRLERARQAVITGQPVEAWRFETVHAGYERLLRSYKDSRELSGVVQAHLADLSRLERAAESARTIERILNRSHRRDESLNRLAKSLADEDRAQAQSFRVVGMIQPSSRRIEGRKLYSLIGPDGSTRAYLDIPPGIDAETLIARRVGVRGTVHYDEDLGARLITVRDLEEIKARR